MLCELVMLLIWVNVSISDILLSRMNTQKAHTEILHGDAAVLHVQDEHVARLSQGLVENFVEGNVRIPENVEREEYANWYTGVVRDAIHTLLASKNIAVARQNDEVAGMAGYEYRGTYQGKDVYEIAKVSVLPEFRGQKLSVKLMERVMDEIAKKGPNAVAVIDSKDPRILDWVNSRTNTPLTHQDYFRICAQREPDDTEQVRKWLSAREREGWQVFLLDPSANAEA